MWNAIFSLSKSWQQTGYSYQTLTASIHKIDTLYTTVVHAEATIYKLTQARLFTYENICTLDGIANPIAWKALQSNKINILTQETFDLIVKLNPTQTDILLKFFDIMQRHTTYRTLVEVISSIMQIEQQYQADALATLTTFEKQTMRHSPFYSSKDSLSIVYENCAFDVYFNLITLFGGIYSKKSLAQRILEQHQQNCKNDWSFYSRRIFPQNIKNISLPQALRFIYLSKVKEPENITDQDINALIANMLIIVGYQKKFTANPIYNASSFYTENILWEPLHLLDSELNLEIIHQYAQGKDLDRIFDQILVFYEYMQESTSKNTLREFIYAALELPTFLSITLDILDNLAKRQATEHMTPCIEKLLNLPQDFNSLEDRTDKFSALLVSLKDASDSSIDTFDSALKMLDIVNSELKNPNFSAHEKNVLCSYLTSGQLSDDAEQAKVEDLDFIINNANAFYYSSKNNVIENPQADPRPFNCSTSS